VIFTSMTFFVFYALVLGVYWLLRGQAVRVWLLLVASQVFYAWWDWRFLFLMWFVTFVSYMGGIVVDRSERWRKPALIVSTVLVLAMLGVFKYFNFFVASAVSLGNDLGFHMTSHVLDIILPVGISFFTFEAISYVVDIYRREIHAERNIAYTAMYISFFPHLAAGPILRAHDFMPQLRTPKVFDGTEFLIGIKMFLIGYVYKAVFSDGVSPFVDAVYQHLSHYDNLSVVSATVGFYAQIYFDFCGYSLMAIGMARTFGYTLMRNFDFPYVSRNITEFWRRWHISLSTWLRDYLYIPLGGNRHGEWKRKRNLMLTMLLGGLWHGASWNFVAWGGMHGVALVVHKRFAELTRGRIKGGVALLLAGLVAWAVTQLFVTLTWIPFRAQTFGDSLQVLGAFTGSREVAGAIRGPIPWAVLLAPILLDTLVVGVATAKLRARRWLPQWNPLAVAAVFGLLMALALCLMPLKVTSFIYFQF